MQQGKTRRNIRDSLEAEIMSDMYLSVVFIYCIVGMIIGITGYYMYKTGTEITFKRRDMLFAIILLPSLLAGIFMAIICNAIQWFFSGNAVLFVIKRKEKNNL